MNSSPSPDRILVCMFESGNKMSRTFLVLPLFTLFTHAHRTTQNFVEVYLHHGSIFRHVGISHNTTIRKIRGEKKKKKKHIFRINIQNVSRRTCIRCMNQWDGVRVPRLMYFSFKFSSRVFCCSVL